jgi:cytochrome b
MRRFFVTAALLLLILALLWPWITRLGGWLPLGRLPGDINVQRPGLSIHIWLGTSILASIVLSLILWLLRR